MKVFHFHRLKTCHWLYSHSDTNCPPAIKRNVLYIYAWCRSCSLVAITNFWSVVENALIANVCSKRWNLPRLIIFAHVPIFRWRHGFKIDEWNGRRAALPPESPSKSFAYNNSKSIWSFEYIVKQTHTTWAAIIFRLDICPSASITPLTSYNESRQERIAPGHLTKSQL